MRLKFRKVKDNDGEQKEHKQLSEGKKKVLSIVLCALLLLLVIVMVLARTTGNEMLQTPEGIISSVVTPVQSLFSSMTDGVVSYLYKLKLRANLEEEYNNLKSENELLVYQARRVEFLEDEIATYEDLIGEISSNAGMNPIVCSVIGRDSSNYFSVFTIDKGSNDGIEDFMAVTTSGALVGLTYDVTATTSKVRTIIDSEASIPCLIESSRDQGTVRGTYGINGEFMCRMYYLSYSTIPRPGDSVVTSGVSLTIPKGIPVGTVVESTRGMDDNKQYIVVEPIVDFQHIEYVIVYRYTPVAESASARSGSTYTQDFATLTPTQPIPTIMLGNDVVYLEATLSPAPSQTPGPDGVLPVPQEGETDQPGATSTPDASQNIQYHVPNATDAPSATTFAIVTPTPSPTPTPTFDPSSLTVEED